MIPFAGSLMMDEDAPPPIPPTTISVTPRSRFGVGQSASFDVGQFTFSASTDGYGPDAFEYRFSRIDGSTRTGISPTVIPVGAASRTAIGRVFDLAVGEDLTSRWYVDIRIPGVPGRGGSAVIEIGGYRQT